MSGSIKQAIRSSGATWVGRLLMAVSLGFISVRLWDYRRSLGEELTNPKLLLATILCSGVYALSGYLLAFGWWLILDCQNSKSVLEWKSAWRIYGKTQIAKYIPGNIFHFAGRHVLGAKAGVPHRFLVIAATGEIIMMLIATGLISLLAAGTVYRKISNHLFIPQVIIGAALLGLVGLAIVCRRFNWQNFIQGLHWRKLLQAQLSYLAFFSVSISLFLFLLYPAEGAFTDWQLIAGAYACAWAIGFLIPGAPGGLGVREAMLVTFLSSSMGEKPVLLTALLFRLVTTFGDVLFFLLAGIKRPAGTGLGHR